jgi:hypothetical protein
MAAEGEASGGRDSSLVSSTSRGCGEAEERHTERQNSSSVLACVVSSRACVRKQDVVEKGSSTGSSRVLVS